MRRIKYILLLVLGAAMLAFMVGYHPRDISAGGRKTEIQFWHPFGGPWYEALLPIVGEFHRANDDTAVHVVFMGNHVSRDQKFYMSVVGGCPPDVVFVPCDRVAEWSHRRLLTPLDDLIREDETLRKEGRNDPEKLRQEFFEPCWRSCTYRGRMYAVTVTADPVWGMTWNKRKLREFIASGEIPAGAIDPEKPPQTVEELDHFNDVVRKFEGSDKRLVRVGCLPFASWTYDDVIYPWGWAFGGDFYDEKTGRITANRPEVVQALEWLCREAVKCDIRKVKSMTTAGGKNAFVEGTFLIDMGSPGWIVELPKAAPDMAFGRDIGVATMPHVAGKEPGTYVGGWTLAIPAGVTDPARRKAAMRFILWMCASNEGTSWKTRTTLFIPGWKKSPYFEEAKQDPRITVYLDIVKTAKHYRPTIPIGTVLNRELDRAGSRAVEAACEAARNSRPGKPPLKPSITPQQALDEATANAQEYLDRFLKEYPPPD